LATSPCEWLLLGLPKHCAMLALAAATAAGNTALVALLSR
jgi:hypothetical protein